MRVTGGNFPQQLNLLGLRGALRSRDAVRTAPKSEKKPPTTSSDGNESHRWREGTAAPRDAEISTAAFVIVSLLRIIFTAT